MILFRGRWPHLIFVYLLPYSSWTITYFNVYLAGGKMIFLKSHTNAWYRSEKNSPVGASKLLLWEMDLFFVIFTQKIPHTGDKASLNRCG